MAISGAFREEDLVVGWECGGKAKKVEGLLEAIDSSPLGLMDLIEVNPNLKPQTSNSQWCNRVCIAHRGGSS